MREEESVCSSEVRSGLATLFLKTDKLQLALDEVSLCDFCLHPMALAYTYVNDPM